MVGPVVKMTPEIAARFSGCEKLYATKTTANKILETYGVAIIPNVLTEDECEAMNSGAWDYLERISERFETPIKRDVPETWEGLFRLNPHHGMLMQHFGMGHAQYVWDVRQNPKVYGVFSEIWETPAEDLLVSFDGASFGIPPENTNKKWFRETWLHSDQSFLRNGFECVQGWVTANPVDVGDATLVVLEGSHKLHGEFRQAFGWTEKQAKEDWGKLKTREEHDFFTDRGFGRFIVVKNP